MQSSAQAKSQDATAKRVQTSYQIVELDQADLRLSREAADTRGKRLITFKEVPRFLRLHMKDIENTNYYKANGVAWFYLDTVGMEMKGYYRFNSEGKRQDEMFKPVSKEEFDNLLAEEKAHFGSDDKKQLAVYILRDPKPDQWRIGVIGSDPHYPASLVVLAKDHGVDPKFTELFRTDGWHNLVIRSPNGPSLGIEVPPGTVIEIEQRPERS